MPAKSRKPVPAEELSQFASVDECARELYGVEQYVTTLEKSVIDLSQELTLLRQQVDAQRALPAGRQKADEGLDVHPFVWSVVGIVFGGIFGAWVSKNI